MRRIIAFLMVITMLLCSGMALAEDTFRVAMECNYAPFNWTQAESSDFAVEIEGGGGYADGYDVQIARAIADGLGKKLVIVKTEWDGLSMGVNAGAFDAIIAGMSPTEERKFTIDFTDFYYTSDLVVVVRKDSPYAAATKLEDLSGATITGQLNTFHYSVVPQIPGVNIGSAMENFPVMIIALQSGAIDGYVAEEPGAVADTTANPDLVYLGFEEGAGFVASQDDVSVSVGLAKGSELVGDINTVINGIDEETRLQMMIDATLRQPLNN